MHDLSIRFAISYLLLNSRPRNECVIRATLVRDESQRPLQVNELKKNTAEAQILG